MTALHDTVKIWGFATSELELGDASLLKEHLGDCPECREELGVVRAVRRLAAHAADAVPVLDWSAVDAAVAGLVEQRTARSAGLSLRWHAFLVPIAVLGVAAVAVAARGLPARVEAAAAQAPAAAPAPEPPAPTLPAVLAAEGATRKDGARLAEGMPLSEGDVFKTGKAGSALLRLSDGSRVRLGADTQLRLVALAEDGAALALERGRVAVQASRAIEVSSGGFKARGVASLFTVAAPRGGFEVASARGRVHVERPSALPMLVDTGRKATFAAKGAQARLATLGSLEQSELDRVALSPPVVVASARRSLTDVPELALASLTPAPQGEWRTHPATPLPAAPPVEPEPAPAADEWSSAPASKIEAAPIATVEPAPMAEAELAPLPKSIATPASAPAAYPAPLAAPAAEPAPVLVASAATPAPAPAPSAEAAAMRAALDDKRDLRIRSDLLIAEPQPMPKEVLEAELAAQRAARAAPAAAPVQPQPSPAAVAQPAPAAAPAEAPKPMAAPAPAAPAADLSAASDDAEELFLLRAERSLKRGGCQRFLTGLDEIASDTPATERTERARITRARCFQAQGKAAQAQAEYQRYLREAPKGDFAAEAERHLAPAPQPAGVLNDG